MKKIIYESKEQNKKYNIELSFNEKEVVLKAKEENFVGKEYEASFSLISLIDKNNIFKVCNKMEDSYIYILNLFNNGKYYLSK